MKNSYTTKNESITRFFGLTILFTLPAYTLIALTGMNIILSPEMVFAFIPLSVLAPLGAASYLTYKKSGWKAVKKLLGRSFDYKRIKEQKGYLFALLLMPILFLISWGTANILEMELLPAPVPMIAFIIPFIAFFFAGLSEEIGWMGYAFGPMEQKMGTFKATLFLGLFWALWHLPMYIFTFPDTGLLITQFFSVVMLRFIIVWFFKRTNQSVFITIMLHAVYNVCLVIFPFNFALIGIGFTIFALLIMMQMFKNKEDEFKTIKHESATKPATTHTIYP
jgi:membrane protease YdiL (CAAX protease family)